jgi:hypothetical protein
MKIINYILGTITILLLGFGLGYLAKNLELKVNETIKATSTINCLKP